MYQSQVYSICETFHYICNITIRNIMGVIKDVYDIAKDGIKVKNKIDAVRRSLLAEADLNRSRLKRIEEGRDVSKDDLARIVSRLKNVKLEAALDIEIPFPMICPDVIDVEMAKRTKISRASEVGLEEIVERLYKKITKVKEEIDDKEVNVLSRLQFIMKYNLLLISLLND